MSRPVARAPARTVQGPAPEREDGDARPRSRIRWLVGWVALPGALLLSVFLAGVHVGARYPDLWLSRLIAWLAG
jgi:hypothetical protein